MVVDVRLELQVAADVALVGISGTGQDREILLAHGLQNGVAVEWAVVALHLPDEILSSIGAEIAVLAAVVESQRP